MRIEKKLVRKNMQDIIDIGIALEKFYNGQAGIVLRAIINGRISDEISQTRDKEIPSDRRLGRCEGYQIIIDDIENAIQDMQRLTEPEEGGIDNEVQS